MSLIRLALASSFALALSACSGGGIGNILGPIGSAVQCDPGTQVQLADPTPAQTGVSGSIGRIVIVANGNTNTLYNTSNQWYLTLTDQFGNSLQGGNLSPYDGRSLNHPYGSDYYYASSIGQLPQGSTWTVKLSEQNQNCTAVPLQTFST